MNIGKRTTNLLFCLSVVIACCILIEWSFRELYEDPRAGASSILINNDLESGYYNKPSIDFSMNFDQKGYFDHYKMRVCNDHNGFRVRCGERSIAEKTILGIGDSVTFGAGVDAEQTFLSFLGTALSLQPLNMGVMGYNIAQQSAQLREKSKLIDWSDVAAVLVQFTVNDLGSNIRQWNDRWGTLGPRSLGASMPVINLSMVLTFLVDEFYYRFVYESNQPDCDELASCFQEVHIAYYRRHLSELVRALRSRVPDAPILFLMTPTKNQMAWEADRYEKAATQNLIRPIAEENGLHVLDCREVLPGQASFIDRTHLNVSGHRDCARLVLNALK